MQAALPEFDFTCARDPEVDRVCRSVLIECVTAVSGIEGGESLLLAGSLATGAACGAIQDGVGKVLSDVDLVVVPAKGRWPALRGELARLSEGVSEIGKGLGLLSHVDYGVLGRRNLVVPRDSLFLHDLARTGRTLVGSTEPLQRLRRCLGGRPVSPVEGWVLVNNRIAGQVFMLSWLGSVSEEERWVARYQFSKAYADNRIAVEVALGVSHHPILDRQEEAARRWQEFRDDPARQGAGPVKDLFEEWKLAVRDQLEVADELERCGGQRMLCLRKALAWNRYPGPVPSLGHRVGLRGSPLDESHDRCREVARLILDGSEPPEDLAKRAKEAVSSWRLATNGTDDVELSYASKVGRLLRMGKS